MSAGDTPWRELTIQGLIQQHGREYLRAHPRLSVAKQNVLKDLAACRTGKLGTHTLRCEECGYQAERPNSCRNRHCASCGGSRRAAWLEQLLPQLLPTSYLQVVFTLPHELIPLVQRRPRELYALLFRAAWATLKKLAADPQHLGAKLGAMAVLHTWNQEMQLHPHVHFILPAGGVSLDGERWVPCRRRKGKHGKPGGYYLFPHKVISRLFRGKFMDGLRTLVSSGQLNGADLPPSWQTSSQFRARCAELYQQEWIVYQEAPPPHLEPAALVKYLARYVAGSAIGDQRLVGSQQGRVTFSVKNRSTGNWEPREISINEFLSRYLLHVLPTGLTRIRYFGFWSARHAEQRLKVALLCVAATGSPSDTSSSAESGPLIPSSVPITGSEASEASRESCPRCLSVKLILLASPPFSRARVRSGLLHAATVPNSGRKSWMATRERVPSRADPPSVESVKVASACAGESDR